MGEVDMIKGAFFMFLAKFNYDVDVTMDSDGRFTDKLTALMYHSFLNGMFFENNLDKV